MDMPHEALPSINWNELALKTGGQVSLQWRLRAKPSGVTKINEQP